MQSSYRDMSRLRAQHHSVASSSEPSLIPVVDDVRPPSSHAHQELTTNDLIINRYASNPSFSRTDNADEERGKDLAAKCYTEDEDFLAKEKIAEWLGGNGQVNKIALHHYMNYFDFTGLRLDNVFRRLCAKLLTHSSGVVHAVVYSILLLNTDLHIADIANRMSRNQFVRNTIMAIQTQTHPSRYGSSPDLNDDNTSGLLTASDGTETQSLARSKRSGSIASWNSISKDTFFAATSNHLINVFSEVSANLNNRLRRRSIQAGDSLLVVHRLTANGNELGRGPPGIQGWAVRVWPDLTRFIGITGGPAAASVLKASSSVECLLLN
ncbi:Sec7 domain-containing protein [Suillus tomentosus]|nr:Sec7 domain-containing protein [Suillus tomentosus]